MSEDESFRVHRHAAVRPRKPRKAPRSGEVVTMRVDPLVWAAALEAADGDATRIVVEDSGSVTIVNKGRR